MKTTMKIETVERIETVDKMKKNKKNQKSRLRAGAGIRACAVGLLLAGALVFESGTCILAADDGGVASLIERVTSAYEAEEASSESAEETPAEDTSASSESAEETPAEEASYYAPKEHADMDYADMVYVPVDTHAIDDLLTELDEITEGVREVGDPEGRTVEIYRELLDVLSTEYTHYVLGDLQHYMHVNDEEINENNRQDTLAIQDMSDTAYLALQKALKGPYGSALRGEFSEAQLKDLEEYEALTDRERELTDRETELEQKYESLSEEEYSFEYKGETWTLDRLYEETPDDYDDIVEIYLGISGQMDEAIVPVFLELVDVRKEIAELEGYDTYTDYCYDVFYGRDFTGEDVARLRETVLEELKPLYNDLKMMQYMSTFDIQLSESLNGEQILDVLSDHIGKVQPQLMEAFDYLREHKLYCIDNTDEMVDVGFTSDLPEYGSAFIFDKTNGTIHDLETIVHEFGHFNATYHAKGNILTDSLLVDVAEIQSQGLEMLFLDEMKEILPDDPEGLQLYLVMNMLDSILSGFEYDEFQQEVYAGNYDTAEKLNKLAMDIDRKYTEYFYDDNGEAYEWVMVNHTFTSPLYYIGYATSALSALDIWTQSLEDRDAAIDNYMKLSAVPPDMPYQEATTSCGLRNMLEPESIRELAEEISAWADENLVFGYGDFDFPFFDEEDPFIFGEEDPFLHGEEDPFAFEWEEVPPAESGENREDIGQQDESYGGEYEYDRTFWDMVRFVLTTGALSIVVRIVVLVIALAAYFRKKNQGGGGSWNDPQGGGWNDPNGGDWNNPQGGGWNSQTGGEQNNDGPETPPGWR